MRQFLSIKEQPLQIDDPRSEVALLFLHGTSQQLLAGNYSIDESRFFESLAILRNGDAGALLYEWLIASNELERATRLVINRIERRPLCFKHMVTADAEHFRNVVMTYFINGLQPMLAQTNARTHEIFTQLDTLETLLQHAEPSMYSDYRQHRQQIISRGTQTVVNHVTALQPLLTQCGFMPNQNP